MGTNDEILLLNNEIKKIKRARRDSLSKANSIKTISICCLALLGVLSFDILYIVLGGLVLAYKPINKKKGGLQWTAGFLSILPAIAVVIGTILININTYSYSDDYYDYYEYPYYYEGLPILIIGQILFYAGSIVSLIFVINQIKATDSFFKNKIDEINNKIKQIEQEAVVIK